MISYRSNAISCVHFCTATLTVGSEGRKFSKTETPSSVDRSWFPPLYTKVDLVCGNHRPRYQKLAHFRRLTTIYHSHTDADYCTTHRTNPCHGRLLRNATQAINDYCDAVILYTKNITAYQQRSHNKTLQAQSWFRNNQTTAAELGIIHYNKYQLSLIDPRDGIVLKTELDDHCDKLAVDRRSSEVLSAGWQKTVQFITRWASIFVELSWWLAPFDDRYAKAKLSMSGVFGKVPAGSTLIFGDTRISFSNSVG